MYEFIMETPIRLLMNYTAYALIVMAGIGLAYWAYLRNQ